MAALSHLTAPYRSSKFLSQAQHKKLRNAARANAPSLSAYSYEREICLTYCLYRSVELPLAFTSGFGLG